MAFLVWMALGACRDRDRSGSTGRPGKGEGGATMSGAGTGTAPGGIQGEAMTAAAGQLEVAFLGFDQSTDAKQRLIRYQLTNRSRRPIRSVRLVLRYRDGEGMAVGSFPLQVVRAPGTLGPGVTARDTFELLGQEGPVEAVADVRIEVVEIRFEDGARWQGMRAP